ncbi:MAG: class I SAM-dependent methyltransferase [Saprospiraceae bacterium]|nr:class I SAM-dependent methyltransferase [Saprospiraceae bacterium]
MHPLLVRVVAQNLINIFIEKRHADKVMEHALKAHPKAGSRDRAFIAETTYEVLRHFRLYQEILGKDPVQESDFWQLIGIHFSLKNIALPPWRELEPLNTAEFQQKINEWRNKLQQTGDVPRAIRESIPDWLDTLGVQELSDQWPPTLHALNQPASVVLRANRLQTTPEKLQKALHQESIETEIMPGTDALVLKVRKNVFQSAMFKKGWFEVQDFSSQKVAPLLAPEPGMRVVDACAGGGGKTLHIAAMMQNKGSIIALDTHAWKLDELRKRARRAGASNIDTRPIESKKTIKRLYNSADRLLLDVPCSGLGVLRRNPDAKWKLQPDQIELLRKTQQDILQSYAPITKPGGRMVYATCSILPSENQFQVHQFLQSEIGKEFTLLTDQKILPQDEGFDGFYMALL